MKTTGKVETWLFSLGSEKPSQSCRFGIHISTAVSAVLPCGICSPQWAGCSTALGSWSFDGHLDDARIVLFTSQ